MNPWRIGGKNHSQGGGLGLVADNHAAVFYTVTPCQDIKIQSPGQGVEHLVHVGQHEVVLLHVGLAHMLREPRRGRLLPGKIIRGLHAISHRQRAIEIKIGGLLHHLDQVARRDFPQAFTRSLGLAHVPGEESRIGLADLGNRLTSDEVKDLFLFEALVGSAPAQDRNIQQCSGSLN